MQEQVSLVQASDDGLSSLLVSPEGFELTTLYNGTVQLLFEAALHRYYVWNEEGEKEIVTGVTSAVGMIDKSSALTQWAANQTIESLRQHARFVQIKVGDVVTSFIDQTTLEGLYNQARFNFKDISSTAKDIGKIAHNWLETYIKRMIFGLQPWEGQELAIPDDERAANCVKAALDWMEKHKFHPIGSERKVYSKLYNYSGTYDWEAFVTSCGDPKCCPFEGTHLACGDFKSSRNLYEEYRVQLRAYQAAIREEFPEGPHPDLGVLLRLGKDDGEFEVMYLTAETEDADFAAFLGALTLYNWKQQMVMDRKYEKALIKEAKKLLPKPKKVRLKQVRVVEEVKEAA